MILVQNVQLLHVISSNFSNANVKSCCNFVFCRSNVSQFSVTSFNSIKVFETIFSFSSHVFN